MAPPLSRRTSWDTGESSLSAAIRQRRAAGLELLDLTLSNPTVCGFHFDSEAILGALSNPAALVYDPDPRGIHSARQAVALYYQDHHAHVDPAHLILTTSTSEAYSFLFRLLADPGDSILVAQPSYPLFDFLAGLNDVTLEPYPLFQDFGWWIDLAELERRITPRTRAIVLVHPNNPTGHATGLRERHQLEQLCLLHNLALIVDEVFLDYGLDPSPVISTFAQGPHPCLTFVVSGLSKIAALPQMKVGWLACFGPEPLLREALDRLEVVADTFLSMNSPAQLALPAWLSGRQNIVNQIRSRVHANLAEANSSGSRLTLLPVEAGWSAIFRLPRPNAAQNVASDLVNAVGVLVHPGEFYGLPGHHYLVASLIGPTETFRRGIEKLNNWCEPSKLTPRDP
jgi:alanine-synthesizing transaminase